MKQSMTAVPVRTVQRGSDDSHLDVVAVEEPLEILVNGVPAGITMRTPGHDSDLAMGLLYNEGVIDGAVDIEAMRMEKNTCFVTLRAGLEADTSRMQRMAYANSSCGVCGKLSIDAIKPLVRQALAKDGPLVSGALVHELPERLRVHQAVFDQTGGLHAAALFSIHGELLGVREDIGRHNAVDKLVGASLLYEDARRSQSILFVSGRAGFELVQKAVTAGIPVMAAVGAPSSLAVETALRFGMTLAGFVRDHRFNVYAGGWRIT